MKRRLEYLVPAGIEPRRELMAFSVGAGISFVYSMKFLILFFAERSDLLYQIQHLPAADARLLKMPCFSAVMDHACIGFLLLALCMPVIALFHYLFHYQGSKSIYLMRRLPDRWELLRRCIALPVCGALLCLLCALAVTLLWAGVYLLFTPREMLSPLWYL